MHRSTSAPLLRADLPKLSLPAASILNIAYDSSLADEDTAEFCPIASSSWSPLIRWTENPLRLQALTVFTIAANAGVTSGEWNGQQLSVLRRSGEWHNLISAPKLRPSIAYVKQIITEHEAGQADDINTRARGVEWFLLSQLAMNMISPLRGDIPDIQPALITPSQVGCSLGAAGPSIANQETRDLEGLFLSPTDATDTFEHIPLAGRPWGLAAVCIKTPMFEVSSIHSIMQLLVQDDPRVGSRSILMNIGTRRVVRDYVKSVRHAVRTGMVVSLHTLHINDICMLLINEAKAPVAPTSNSWFVGVDRAILHFCRDELLACLEDKRPRRDLGGQQILIEALRHAQSKYLRAVEDKFERTGIVEGLAVSSYEDKIRLCVEHSFFRLVSRLRRGDPTDTLISFLRENKPMCRVDYLGVAMVEDMVYEMDDYSTDHATQANQTTVPTTVSNPASWLHDLAAGEKKTAESEIIRSEPRVQSYGIDPNANGKLSCMDVGLQDLLSNRSDKLVWLENRDGGYWRCLLPWIMLAECSYEIRSNDSGTGLWIRDISAPHRRPRTFHSFQELHDEIKDRLREDMRSVWVSSQTMPNSWLDPEVRASLLILIAGARGDIRIETFSPCVKRLVGIVHAVGYRTVEDIYPALTDEEEEKDQSQRESLQYLERRDYPCAKLTTIKELFLPEEIHTCVVHAPQEITKKLSWIGIRWHEETLLAAPGIAEDRVLHAEDSYILLTSNTFDLKTRRASESCNAESWIVGAVTAKTVFHSDRSRLPRMETPHIEIGAHSLEMFWMAAERALGVKIGVLWTRSGVDAAIIIRGARGLLEQFAAWIPGISILGHGYSPPPALANRHDRQYFSRGRFAARVWTQDQFRGILAKQKQRLAQELGAQNDSMSSGSSYMAHAVADCIVLFLHLKLDLPLIANGGIGWGMYCRNGDSSGLRMNQPLMLPQSMALRVENEDNVEIAVDSENKLVWRKCEFEEVVHAHNDLKEYKVYPKEGTSYVRIATGTVEDCAFSKSGQRVLCKGT